MAIADSKLSALTELAAAPATNDQFYIRDVSECADCESKRITWSNIFLNADLPGTLDVSGAGTFDSSLTVVGLLTSTDADVAMDIQNSHDGSSVTVALFKGGNRATPTDSDEGNFIFQLDNCAGVQTDFVRFTWKALDVGPSCTYDSRPEFQYFTAGTFRELVFPAITADDTVAVLGLAQTFTNKTLTAPTIADFTNAAHDHGDADDGGAVVCGAVPATHSGSAHHALVTTSGTSTLLSISTQDIVVADNWDVAGTLDVTGAAVLDSTLAVAGVTTLSADLQIRSSGDIEMEH